MRVADPENSIGQQVELLRLLREHGAQTRSELSQRSGYSVSLVRQLTQRLQEHGLMREEGLAAQRTPGRPSQQWGLAPGACRAVGLDVGGNNTRLVVLDALGQVTHSASAATLQAESGDALLRFLAQFAREELTKSGLEPDTVAGLGIAFSGIMDAKRGTSLDAPNIAASHQLPLQTALEAALGVPVLVDDSSRTMALAEMRYGAGKGSSDFLCVNVGAGIGMGIISNGQLQRGTGLAGELGHIPMQIHGERCRCGSQGCLETLASGSAIAAKARRMLEQGVASQLHEDCQYQPEQVSARLVTEAARSGDRLALDLLHDAGTWLGLGIETVMNLFAPEKVVLTGGVMRRNALLLQTVREVAERYALPQHPRPLPILLTPLDELAAALGAATLILDEAFESGFMERLSRADAS